MLWRVETRFRDPAFDGEARHVARAAADAGVPLERIETRRTYLLQGDGLDRAVAEWLARELLTDPVTEAARVSPGDAPGDAPGDNNNSNDRCDAGDAARAPVVVTIRKRPGVMDPVAQSVMRGARDLGAELLAATTQRTYRLWPSDAHDAGALFAFARRALANELIEQVELGDPPLTTLLLPAPPAPGARQIAGFRGLDAAGRHALDQTHGLAMSDAELLAVQAHFQSLGRDPTDVELLTLAQTWSEHCKHKTLTAPIVHTDEHGERSFENLLQDTIGRATRELALPWCLSVFVDNAGVIAFDETTGVAMKVETHNHPSALEPYGGAGTGTGGVIRDILGTGLGARPVLNTDVFAFGPPDLDHDRVPPGALHPRRVMAGVAAGVRDYGNRMGIPTANGAVVFHERYVGNPLVFCGCVGLLPREKIDKAARPGDVCVVTGGRTGRDGIGGATFSSAELTDRSEVVSAGAVQIGNAIEEKRVLDALLRCRDERLYTAITDCGAGGLSSAAGEMAEAIGVRVELSDVPLKYAGLSPAEVWLSEAQERMVFAVPPERLERFCEVCAEEDVAATVIGRFTGDGRLRVTQAGETVAELEMAFLHHGLPRPPRTARFTTPARTAADLPVGEDYAALLMRLLALPNVASKEALVRQYDHEVQGASVVKPFVGPARDGPSDACVLAPRLGSRRGLVVSNGICPEYGLIDPYAMAANAIDEAIRNNLAVGGTLARLALLDNFCWGDASRPEVLGELVRACEACRDLALAFGTPFISGKDSLNNTFVPGPGQPPIAVPPTLLISALSVIDDVARCQTMDLKRPGDVLLAVGLGRPEFGGSHLNLALGVTGTDVPLVRPEEARRTFAFVERALADGQVSTAHDCSEGGLAVTLAEMSFAGGIGATVELGGLPLADVARHEAAERDCVALFCESASRFVLAVAAGAADALVARAHDAGVAAAAIGVVEGERLVIASGGRVLIDAVPDDLKRAWQAPLARLW